MPDPTRTRWMDAAALLRADPTGLPYAERHGLASSITDALVQRDLPEGHVAVLKDLVDLLVRDPDWGVRDQVAQMLHLLDEDACSRCVALLRTDASPYVRAHAERSLARQRRVRQAAGKAKSESRRYGDQVDQLVRQYGPRTATKIRGLADQRFALMASAVAHDVRSILTTLSANAAALAGETGPSRRMASILEDVRYLERTVEAVEQYAKPLAVHRLPEELLEMLEEAVEKARGSVIALGYDPAPVEITVAAPPGVQPQVCRRMVVLALTNVIKNALEAFSAESRAPAAGRIEVCAEVKGYEVQIAVRDNGPGIEAEVLDELRMFVPGTPNKAKRQSTGWGLCLAHRYVAAHRGSLEIQSAVDQGTTVLITLSLRTPTEGEDE